MAHPSMYSYLPATPSRPLRAASDQAGVTLVEILVCLMLVALLAAAVFPVVTQRVGRDEPLRVARALSGIAEGVEAFGRDLGGALPGDLEDLVAPVGRGDRMMSGSREWEPVSDNDSRRWKGPYIEAAIADGGSLLTGFGVPIGDDLLQFDARANAPFGSGGYDSGSPTLFLALEIGSAGRQLTSWQFEAINDLIDGSGEPDGPGIGTSWSLGRIRFDNSRVVADTIAYFLAVPLTP